MEKVLFLQHSSIVLRHYISQSQFLHPIVQEHIREEGEGKMVKKHFWNESWFLPALVILLALFWLSNNPIEINNPAAVGASDGSVINISFPWQTTPASPTPPAPTPPITPPVPDRADLRGVFQPYLVVYPDSPTACAIIGGTWYWSHDRVGCEGSGGGIGVCSDAVMIAAMGQCAAVGAEARCDYWDAYCKYV